jgi:hypothetical protein
VLDGKIAFDFMFVFCHGNPQTRFALLDP